MEVVGLIEQSESDNSLLCHDYQVPQGATEVVAIIEQNETDNSFLCYDNHLLQVPKETDIIDRSESDN